MDSFGAERNLHYICGANGLAAIYVTTADKDTMYYAFTDYQHNLLALTDAAGKPYERYSYDPWGNPLKYCDPTGMSETEGDHMEAHAKARHMPSDNNEPIMQWESQNGVIYKIFDCGDKYLFQANYNITCYGLGFMSKGGKTGKSEFDAGFDNSDLTKTLSQFQSGMENSYSISGCGYGTASRATSVLGTLTAASQYVAEKSLAETYKYYTKGVSKIKPTETPVRLPNGKFMSVSAMKNITKVAKVGGVVFGVAGLALTAKQVENGEISKTEGALDAMMTGVAFIPGYGWAVSGAYFIGKMALEEAGLDFWHEK